MPLQTAMAKGFRQIIFGSIDTKGYIDSLKALPRLCLSCNAPKCKPVKGLRSTGT
jgi:hypothetical protein